METFFLPHRTLDYSCIDIERIIHFFCLKIDSQNIDLKKNQKNNTTLVIVL